MTQSNRGQEGESSSGTTLDIFALFGLSGVVIGALFMTVWEMFGEASAAIASDVGGMAGPGFGILPPITPPRKRLWFRGCP